MTTLRQTLPFACLLFGFVNVPLSAQPTSPSEGIKTIQALADRLKNNPNAAITQAEKEQVQSILNNAKDWNPADQLAGLSRIISILGTASGRTLLLPGSDTTLALIIQGLKDIDEAEFRSYTQQRELGRSPEDAGGISASKRAAYELKYQYNRLLKTLPPAFAVSHVWGLDETDSDAPDSTREFTYKVSNLGTRSICDFSFLLPNTTDHGSVTDTIVQDLHQVLPPGWKIEKGGNVIRFLTDTPGACIMPFQFKTFTFRVGNKYYSATGTLSAAASTLVNGDHREIQGSTISNVTGPVVVSLTSPPDGSKIVVPSSVLVGQVATISALGPGGDVLRGQVLEVNGERKTTDQNGRVQFTIAATATELIAAFSLSGGPKYHAPVVKIPPTTTGSPAVTTSTPYTSPGGQVQITGTGFSGTAANNSVKIGVNDVPVLASSPTSLVASVPRNMPLGDPGPLTVTTGSGTSVPAKVQLVEVKLSATNTSLLRGQKGNVTVTVEGTSDRVPVLIRNVTPQVVTMTGGVTQTKTTSGGNPNTITVKLQGVSAGSFSVTADIAQPPKKN